MSDSQTQQIRAVPISKAPNALFIIFWLGFTSVHAFFMLGGALRTSERVLLLSILIVAYLLFFGIGFWMLRTWLRWRTLQRRYGDAVIEQAPRLEPGEQTEIQVKFDQAWPAEVLAAHPLTGTLAWQQYDSDGEPKSTVHSIPVALQTTPAGNHTAVRVSLAIPQNLPADALQSSCAELLLETKPGQGWRFMLPFKSQTAAFEQNQPPSATPLTAAQAANVRRALGVIAVLAVVGAAGMAVYALANSHFSFFQLAFAVPLTYLGVLLWRVRSTVHAPVDTPSAEYHAVNASSLSERVKRGAPVIAVVMFAAFAADIFVPRDFSQRISSAITRPFKPSLGVKRPQSIATFALPTYPFNSQMAMQVAVQGTGTLNQNTLILDLDSLELTELLSHDSNNRLVHKKLGLVIFENSGDYVRSVTNEVTLLYNNAERSRSIRFNKVQAVFDLAPAADLSQIWLRLKVYEGENDVPIDAAPGHIAHAIAQTDAAFSTCSGVMSIRTAIALQCNAELAQKLASPHWQLWEHIARWRAQPPLMHYALSSGNAQAVSVLHKAGVGVEELDEQSRTALMRAAWNHRLDFVDALLAAGADPLYRSQADKHSALTGSLYDHHLASARKLLKSPSDLDGHLTAWNYRAEHRVAMDGHIQTLQMLLDAGVSVNSVNGGSGGRGETLLMAAARSKVESVAMLKLLLERGAQLNALDAHGKNATDWAEFFGNAEASDFLCARGLEPTPLDTGGQNNEKRKRASCQVPSAART